MIKLEKEVSVTIGNTIKVTEFDIIKITDYPELKKVVADLKFGSDLVAQTKDIVLWENIDNEKESDLAYDKIGNWTQEQAEQRIIEILSK